MSCSVISEFHLKSLTLKRYFFQSETLKREGIDKPLFRVFFKRKGIVGKYVLTLFDLE